MKTINKRIIQKLAGCLALGVFVVGCNSQRIPEARNFTLETKRRVLEFQTTASKDAKAAKAQIEILVENLDEAKNEQLAEHKATVDEITTIAKELQGLYGRSASASQTGPKVKQMADLANKLPGEVQSSDAAASTRPRDF